MHIPMNYDEMAEAYSQNRKIHPGVLQNLLETAGLSADQRVLEVGCGTGNYILAVQAAADCACEGIDPSAKMLENALSRGGKVRFQQGAAEKLPLPDGVFDLLYTVDVIHHIGNRADYFREAARVLKPGGLICTVTDNEMIIHGRVPLAKYFPEIVEPEIARYPRIDALREEMCAAGFSVRENVIVRREYDLTDIKPYEDKAFSSLHLISDEAWQRGLERLRTDLAQGPIKANSNYLMLWGDKEN